MRKLIQGIVDFRQKLRPEYRDTFAKLALGQSPDVLFIACSDSRVVPNLFASTDPGDLFVVRNVGNLVPPCGAKGVSTADESEAAAIEFAVETLKVDNIVLCGHSECGAIQALSNGREKLTAPNLRAWLRHAEPCLTNPGEAITHGRPRKHNNYLSQLNVLQQLEHLKSYPVVKARMQAGNLKLHGWWFELASASVYAYEPQFKAFMLIDEEEAARILKLLDSTSVTPPSPKAK